MSSANDDADLVRAAQAGDQQAFTTLFERWFDRSYDVAWRIVRNRDTAAEVAQDTFLTAYTKLESLRDPDAFGGWVLRTSRNKALNRLEREGRSLAFDTDDTVGMVDRERSAVDVADDIVRHEQHDLVWAAAAALGERDASILDLHLRHDLDPAQIAEALDITPNAAHQTLFRLRKRLEGAIRSYVLWNGGQPTCDDLDRALVDQGIEGFGPAAVKAISRHVAECEVCDERQGAVLAPASMFAAVPILAVGLDVRRAAAAELASHGVPIDPDLLSGSSGGSTGVDGASNGQAPASGSASRRGAKVLAGAAIVLLFLVGMVAGVTVMGDDGSEEAELAAQTGTTEASMTTGAPPTTEASTTTRAPTTTEASTTTRAPTTAEPPPTTTERPTTQPPVTDPPPTTSTDDTTSTTTEEPTLPGPEVRGFRLTPGDLGLCGARSGQLYELVWVVDHADTVTIEGPNLAEPGPHPPTGSTATCAPMGETATWILTASGPGGEVTESVSVP